jgi:hypothetical protein
MYAWAVRRKTLLYLHLNAFTTIHTDCTRLAPHLRTTCRWRRSAERAEAVDRPCRQVGGWTFDSSRGLASPLRTTAAAASSFLPVRVSTPIQSDCSIQYLVLLVPLNHSTRNCRRGARSRTLAPAGCGSGSRPRWGVEGANHTTKYGVVFGSPLLPRLFGLAAQSA